MKHSLRGSSLRVSAISVFIHELLDERHERVQEATDIGMLQAVFVVETVSVFILNFCLCNEIIFHQYLDGVSESNINNSIKKFSGNRFSVIYHPALARSKRGKLRYESLRATIRDVVPMGLQVTKVGNILVSLMSVNQLDANIDRMITSKRGRSLYQGNRNAFMQDIGAVMDRWNKGQSSDSYFQEKYGGQWEQRKNFVNLAFGLSTRKQTEVDPVTGRVPNPLFLEDNVRGNSVFRTYRVDRMSRATKMSGERPDMPVDYAAAIGNLMPNGLPTLDDNGRPIAERFYTGEEETPDTSLEDLNPVTNKQEAQRLWADGKQMFAVHEMDETLIPITSKAMLDSYSAEAIVWMEPEAAPAGEQAGDVRLMPEDDVEVKVVERPTETTEQGTPAPDSDVQSIPLTGNPIPWDQIAKRQMRFMPESNRNAFPMMTPKLLDEIEKETKTLAAIHIDRMKVGEYEGIDLQGGMFYPTIKENLENGVVWAFNSPGVARTVANRAAQNNGYVKLVLMQEGNVIGNKTFANIWFKILSNKIDNKEISKALALTELNAARRLVYKTLKSRDKKRNPWIESHSKRWNSLDEAKEAILSMPQIERASTYFKKSKTQTKSEGEKIAYQALLSQKMSKLGFPDARKIVNDIEEPAFKGIPTGAAVAIIKFDPLGENDKIMTAKDAGVPEHMSYGYVLKGKPIAKLGYYQVIEETFPKTKGQIMTQQHTDFPIKLSIPFKGQARGRIRYNANSPSAIANASKLK